MLPGRLPSSLPLLRASRTELRSGHGSGLGKARGCSLIIVSSGNPSFCSCCLSFCSCSPSSLRLLAGRLQGASWSRDALGDAAGNATGDAFSETTRQRSSD